MLAPLRLDLAREAVALGRLDLAHRWAEKPVMEWAVQAPAATASLAGTLAEAEGRVEPALAAFFGARDAWTAIEEPYETAMAALGAGRCLIALGRSGEAVAYLDEAHGIFAALGALPAVAETEALREPVRIEGR